LLQEPHFDEKQVKNKKLLSRWLHDYLLPLIKPHGWGHKKRHEIIKRRD
jgi:hypothetical protein